VVVALMREMTHEALCQLIRRQARCCGSLSALARRQGVSISTLSNMLHRRNRWTARVLGLLDLAHVRVVAEAAVPAVVEPVLSAPHVRPYRPMWRLGDWPSRYRPAAVVELEEMR
jgi:hypothetical protein